MTLDIRIPIGGMFSILGMILVIYGLMTAGNEMYTRSLGTNVNLIWGGVMLVFGGLMLGFGLRSKPSPAAPSAESSPRSH